MEAVDVYQPGEDEVIKDPLLHWAIRAAMGAIKSNIKLTAEVVGDKAVKDISFEQCAHPEDFEGPEWKGKPFWIESLEGLQYAKSARMIDIAYTSSAEGKRIADVSPIAELTQLETLILKQNGIDDISSLNRLSNLTTLDVSANQLLEDISSVAGMTSLKSLNASFNMVNSIDAISNLENLEYITVSNNQITNLPDCSKLEKVYFLDISHNQLTDVSEIAKMKSLEKLNLSGNTGITDIRPLVALLKLDKDSTTLPDESKKDDLFAAIEVNKLFNLFNISKMRDSDLENVQAALDAFDSLTEDQKTYFDANRIAAARSNKAKVESGAEPEYYPEYDVDGIRVPVWNSIEIQVLDKYGKPMPGIEFSKVCKTTYTETVNTIKTNGAGRLVLKHTTTDSNVYDEIEIIPAGDVYEANPKSIVYTVAVGNITESINGKAATGLEDLVITLIPKEEYVDKTELRKAIDNASKVEEAYKYTESTYQAYLTALNIAEDVYEDVDATKDSVQDATSKLITAISKLTKQSILTELKLIVKDENGNLFSRPFKFLIRVPVTKKEAWNAFSDANTGIAYVKTSPGWDDGKVWEVVSCDQEPYEIEPFYVTIGVKNGQRYFRAVDGNEVDVDYEKVIVAKIRKDGAPNSQLERKPDSTVLKSYLEMAKEYEETNYTPASYRKLQTAIEQADVTLKKTEVTQNDYNQALAVLKNAVNGLLEVANKLELQREINRWYGYTEAYYTAESWEKYTQLFNAAKSIYSDGNATQEVVDEFCAELKNARLSLVRKADKTKLEAKLKEAKAINTDAYQSGVDELLKAIADAEMILNSANVTQEQIDAQVNAIDKAIAGLVKKPVAVNYSCDPGVFRAKVVDKKGNTLQGVEFDCVINGVSSETIKSDKNGCITYIVYGQNRKKTTYIKLADERYTTEDMHYFTADGINDYIVSMVTIDGKAYADGTCLTYVLEEVNGNEPGQSDKITSDKNIFRAKVVDTEGKLVDGVIFVSKTNEGTIYEAVNNKGIVEFSINANDYAKTFTVSLKENQSAGETTVWVSDETHTYETNGSADITPEIIKIDGTALDEIKEIVFVLRKSTDASEPEVVNKKELDDQIFFSKKYEGKGDDYTSESYQVFMAALEEAKRILADENATQKQVDDAAVALKTAREGLVELPKTPVCDATTIRIQVLDKNGNKVTEAVPFKFSMGSYSFTQQNRNGLVEYWITSVDSGVKSIVVAPQQDVIMIDGKEYIASPSQHEFALYEPTSGDVRISAIDGEAFEGTKEVKFVLEEKENTEPPVEPEIPKAPATPKSVKAVLSGGHNDVKVSWDKVEGADGYLFYFKKATSNTWSKAITCAGTSYTRKDLASNVKYDFKVISYVEVEGEKYFNADDAATVSLSTKKNVKAPETVTTKLYKSYDDVKVSWKKVTGAAGYYVYMKKATASTYTYLGRTTALSYVKKDLLDGVKYTFKVTPYYMDGGVRETGFYSKTNNVTTLKKLNTPKVVKSTSKKVKVSWNNIEGETGYQISRSTKKTGTNIVSTYVTASGKTKTLTVTKGKKYYYKVRAYKTVDGKKVYGPWSSVKIYTLK